jgi:hypothetical protein
MYYFRTCVSAGALYPVEVYVACIGLGKRRVVVSPSAADREA